ncbi:MAG: ester cyclase [Polyangiaceae bacterium]|nr:ester cyclase [Polyangiaceae bacterium]
MNMRASLLTALLLVACKGTATPTTPTATASATAAGTATAQASAAPTTPPPSPMEVAKKHVSEMEAAFAAKDVAKLLSFYGPGATVGMGGPAGWQEMPAAAVGKQFEALFAAFPDLQVKMTRVLVAGDSVVSEYVVTGTNTGEFMGEKATGKKIGYAGASAMNLGADGKIAHESMYYDQGTVAAQLGKGPKGMTARAVLTAPTAEAEILVAGDADAKNVDLVKAMNEGMMKKDKAAADMLTDDVVVSMQYDPADQSGKKAVLKSNEDMMKAFVDQKVDVKGCVAAGAYVACETAWTATWKGDAMGMKATGKTGTVHGIDVTRVNGGKVAGITGYGNGLEFAGAFGLLDKAPAGKAPTK